MYEQHGFRSNEIAFQHVKLVNLENYVILTFYSFFFVFEFSYNIAQIQGKHKKKAHKQIQKPLSLVPITIPKIHLN